MKRSFIEAYKNKAIIHTDFRFTKTRVSMEKDDDCHFTGTDQKVGLLIVGEIMNAKSFRGLKTLRQAARHQGRIGVSGAWRLWPEHASGSFTQRIGIVEASKASNRGSHIFEIHPVTRVGDTPAYCTIRKIQKHKYVKASRAIRQFENIVCKVKTVGSKVKLTLSGSTFNYVRFIMKYHEEPIRTDDALFVKGSIHETARGKALASSQRMVFLQNTEAHRVFAERPRSGTMKVYGLPRINLDELSSRIHQNNARGRTLNWFLPYEMVIVGQWEHHR